MHNYSYIQNILLCILLCSLDICTVFNGQFSQNKKNKWIFMQKGVDIYAEKAYSMHCQGEHLRSKLYLYTTQWIL